jgi:ribosomal protein L11 methyltransferase
MKRRTLWKISIATSPEAEDAVAQLLENAFGQLPSSYTHVETRTTTVTVYLTKKPVLDRAKRAEIAADFRRIKGVGFDAGSGKLSLAKVKHENWAESWKRHFKPLEIGPELLIRPSWSKRRARKGQAVVVIDPGLSFGTGQHPTTAFCLQQIVSRRRPGERQSFFDIGSGSGILAIAAVKLGYAPVQAIDCDLEAIRIAHANARQNRISHRIVFRPQEVATLPRRPRSKYTLICANLISNLLMKERGRILAQLEPAGMLVIAGILKEEFAEVQKAYEAAGLELVAAKTENEWRSGSFVRKGMESRL